MRRRLVLNTRPHEQASELSNLLRAAGFDVQRCTSFFAATLPMIAWARLRGRVPNPGSELHISRALNALAAALLVPEWLLVRAGVSLPFGSSLVVVARRPLP